MDLTDLSFLLNCEKIFELFAKLLIFTKRFLNRPTPLGQERRQKIFQGGGGEATRIEPVLTTKNGRTFEIWEV